MITPEQFRAELASRLNEVLPDGFHASASEPGVCLDAPDGLGTWTWAGQFEADPDNLALYRDAGCMLLDSLQDCVSVTLREVWPMAATEPEHRMATPGGKVEGTVLHLWCGDEESPALGF